MIDRTELIDFLETNIIESCDDIDSNLLIITYKPKDYLIEGVTDLEYSNSIAIASAITASIGR